MYALKFNSEHFVISALRENILQMYFPEQGIKIEDVLYILCTLNVSRAQHYSYLLPIFTHLSGFHHNFELQNHIGSNYFRVV